jgi:predicted O-methyltransferase YrrM
MKAVRDVADESLDFVFIDANHEYTAVRDDIREWTKKVRVGGIVSGHDYYKTPAGNMGVINAVNEYVAEHGYTLLLTDKVLLSSGQAGMPPGGSWDRLTIDDRPPCWYFTKTSG